MFKQIKTGIEGFDELIGEGIEKGSTVLVSGGTGTGKTNFCAQYLYHGASVGEKCLYVTFEEPVEQIKRHVAKFGIDFTTFEKTGKVKFIEADVYKLARDIELLFKKITGGLFIKRALPKIIPPNFRPDRIIIDSLSALSSVLKEEDYRYFIFQLFSHLKRTGSTTFAVSETRGHTSEYSRSGIEEFLADGVIVLYNLEHEDLRVSAIEVLKLRGVKHEKRRVPFKITDKGIVVFPKSQVFAV